MRETVAHKILPYLDKSTADVSLHPTAEQLRAYALRVCRQLNGILSATDQKFLPTVFTFPITERITACRFHLVLQRRFNAPLRESFVAQGLMGQLPDVHLRRKWASGKRRIPNASL